MSTTSGHLDLPRGFHDVNPDRMSAQRLIQEEWFRAGTLGGYQPVDIPPVGFADTFAVGHHAAGQRTYEFSDRRGRELALVSDSLPAALRLAQARQLPEQRLSYCCPVFRYERKSRRYFHHLGLMEVSTSPATPERRIRSTRRLAELMVTFLRPHLTADFTITEPGLWYELLQLFVPHKEATEYLNGLRRVPAAARPGHLRADGAPASIVELAHRLTIDPATPLAEPWPTALAPLPPSVGERVDACQRLAEALRRHGAAARVDLSELHASEFHDGPAFLLRDPGGSVLGDGGSYGRFAERFLASPAQVYAAVVGLERMADHITESTPAAADIAVLATQNDDAIRHADELTASLRNSGISVWDVVLTRPIRHHLRELAGLSIPYSVIVGPREVAASQYMVRDHDGNLYQVPQAALAEWMADTGPREVT